MVLTFMALLIQEQLFTYGSDDIGVFRGQPDSVEEMADVGHPVESVRFFQELERREGLLQIAIHAFEFMGRGQLGKMLRFFPGVEHTIVEFVAMDGDSLG